MLQLKIIPKCFTMVTIALFSVLEQTHCTEFLCDPDWVTVALYSFLEYPFKWLQCCLVVTWLVPCETAAISAHVLCTPYNHAPVYSVTLSEAIYVGCLFRYNMPLALLAEWQGSFVCYCGNTKVEWIPKKEHRKLTLEKTFLPVLLELEPITPFLLINIIMLKITEVNELLSEVKGGWHKLNWGPSL